MPTRPWLTIPELQVGERTLQEQMLGLDPALAECKGKRVLDIGCAEGLIGREFALRGAKVDAFDSIQQHIDTAIKQCPEVNFRVDDLNQLAIPIRPEYDIVLALAVLHKLGTPMHGARYCIAIAKSLIVVRLPIGSDGRIVGKFTKSRCDLNKEFTEHGFKLERVEEGPRTEKVQYWRR